MAFYFKTRSPHRDIETDRARFAGLCALLDRLAGEIEAESAGLQARYRRVTDNAAFLQEEFESGQAEAMTARIDELTASLMQCSNRLQTLAEQADFIRRLRQDVATFHPGWQ